MAVYAGVESKVSPDFQTPFRSLPVVMDSNISLFKDQSSLTGHKISSVQSSKTENKSSDIS